MLTVPVVVWWGISFLLLVCNPPGMAAQVIKTHLDSFYISADRAVWGQTLGDKGNLVQEGGGADATRTEHVWKGPGTGK